jgi:predicted DNA-binding transcriptional regulator AlpA
MNTGRPITVVRSRPPAEKPLRSVSWAADRMGLARSTAYSLARAGQLPGLVRLGGRYYIKSLVLEQWLQAPEWTSGAEGPAENQTAAVAAAAGEGVRDGPARSSS